MDLLYKPDWEECKEHFRAWWQHEYFGRCAVAVTGIKEEFRSELPPSSPKVPEERWLHLEYAGEFMEYTMRRTFYGGEAFPVWHAGYPGWSTIPCYLGAPVTLGEDTGWIHPIIQAGRLTDYDPQTFRISDNNRWSMLARDLLHTAVAEARGKSIPSIGAFLGCGDTLAAIRSTESLLMDVVDSPDYVREFELYLMQQWTEVFDTFYDIVNEASEGSTCWCELWSPGKTYAAANDFSYMISPQMFREIYMPALEMQTRFLDHNIYHVDGVAAFAHLDALLELPRLQAFQIIPGAGRPSALHYMDVLQRLQAHKRNLQLYLEPSEVESALENLSARGLFIVTACETEEQAKAVLRICETQSKDRKIS